MFHSAGGSVHLKNGILKKNLMLPTTTKTASSMAYRRCEKSVFWGLCIISEFLSGLSVQHYNKYCDRKRSLIRVS